MIYARCLEPLRKEVARMCGPEAVRELHPVSPY